MYQKHCAYWAGCSGVHLLSQYLRGCRMMAWVQEFKIGPDSILKPTLSQKNWERKQITNIFCVESVNEKNQVKKERLYSEETKRWQNSWKSKRNREVKETAETITSSIPGSWGRGEPKVQSQGKPHGPRGRLAILVAGHKEERKLEIQILDERRSKKTQ
jgi:hypothetical protein